MEQRAKDLIKIGNKLFEDKQSVDSLWQEIALNFYPERADFTETRNAGDEYADHLYSSVPAMARRELGNVISAYLYSRSQKRFSIHVANETLDNSDAERKFLEFITDIQWRAMYDSPAGLSRTAKESGNALAAFGNAVIKFGMNRQADGLLFKSYHLRDNAWVENAEGRIDANWRKAKMSARQISEQWPTTHSKEVDKALDKEPHKEFDVQHIVVPARLYNYKSKSGKQFPFTSLYVETKEEVVLEEVGLNYFCYVIPRWQTVENSQYGLSMATAIVLPDGRTMQVVIRTLREAGEKYVDPPMIGVGDALRGDMALYAGGFTNADIEFDGRLEDVLRPVMQIKDGMPVGFQIAAALKEDIREGFFLDKIRLTDQTNRDMTAYQVRSIIEDQIRSQAPIFDPIEEEFEPLYRGVFDIMMGAGAFPIQYMPPTLRNQNIKFEFRSQLADLADQREAQTYITIRDSILAPAAQFDPAQLANVNWTEATRDAMRAGGWKAKWFNPKDAVDEERKRIAQEAEVQKGLGIASAASHIANQGGQGLQSLIEASAKVPTNEQT